MRTKAILIATAAAASMAAPAAEALTPLSIDAPTRAPERIMAPEHAGLAPAAFERRPESEFEPNAVIADARAHLQCVPYAREHSGVDIFGDAYTWWSQAKGKFQRLHSPKEGAVLVLRGYSSPARGHVAVVREVIGDRLIVVDHANWLNEGEITRDVPVRDVSARGDWSAVQVWHVPGAQWGARTYRVQGFIAAPTKSGQSGAREPLAG
jgi:surface antigen